jgi:hypothetical protein
MTDIDILQLAAMLTLYILEGIISIAFLFIILELTRILIRLNTHTARKEKKVFLLFMYYTTCGFIFTCYLTMEVKSLSEIYVLFFVMSCLVAMRLFIRIIDESSAYVVIGILIGISAQNFLLSALQGKNVFNFDTVPVSIIISILLLVSILTTYIDHGLIQDERLTERIRNFILRSEQSLED